MVCKFLGSVFGSVRVLGKFLGGLVPGFCRGCRGLLGLQGEMAVMCDAIRKATTMKVLHMVLGGLRV